MRANCAELESIRSTIQLYVDAVRESSDLPLRQAFHPKATLYGYFGDTQFISTLQTLCDYVLSVPAPARTGEPFASEITSISVFGNSAAVELTMDSYQGHDLVDYFQLMKIDGRWSIVSKLFTAMAKSQSAPEAMEEAAVARTA